MILLRRWTNDLKITHFVSSICKSSTACFPKEKKIKLGAHVINYIKVGEGAHKVLLLNGALGSFWTDFKPQIQGFDQKKFTLVAWDLPGCGKSRPPDKEFTPDFFEKDAQVAIDFMKALNIPKYSIMAYSDGGKVGMIQAAKAPAAVHKLVLSATNSFILPEELEIYKQTRDLKTWSTKMLQPKIELYGEECLAKLWAKWYDGQEAVFNSNKGDICSSRLKDIKCPTFILFGEKDPMVDKVHVAHLHSNIADSRISSGLPKAEIMMMMIVGMWKKLKRIYLYPEGKHNIHLRYPDDFNKRVQEFLLLP